MSNTTRSEDFFGTKIRPYSPHRHGKFRPELSKGRLGVSKLGKLVTKNANRSLEENSKTTKQKIMYAHSMTQDLIGKDVRLDKKYSNSSIVKLISFGKVMATISDGVHEWTTMLSRLSPLDPDEQTQEDKP